MGLFNKNKKGESSYPTDSASSGLPKLPELPQLPQMPSAQPSDHQPAQSSGTVQRPNALPRFPSNSLGNKFSQNTIKEAVSGEKEDDVVNDFEHEIQKMPSPGEKSAEKKAPQIRNESSLPRYKNSRIMNEDEETENGEDGAYSPAVIEPSRRYSAQKPQGREPVFIRIDKFEESMDIFEKIKKQMASADKLLNEIKSVKEREDEELSDWQENLETMKGQIEKIDRDIFSKVE